MSGELSVDYLGLGLLPPVAIGACPLTQEPETVRQLIQAGAEAIVLPSTLQEQIVHRRAIHANGIRGSSHSQRHVF